MNERDRLWLMDEAGRLEAAASAFASAAEQTNRAKTLLDEVSGKAFPHHQRATSTIATTAHHLAGLALILREAGKLIREGAQ